MEDLEEREERPDIASDLNNYSFGCVAVCDFSASFRGRETEKTCYKGQARGKVQRKKPLAPEANNTNYILKYPSIVDDLTSCRFLRQVKRNWDNRDLPQEQGLHGALHMKQILIDLRAIMDLVPALPGVVGNEA